MPVTLVIGPQQTVKARTRFWPAAHGTAVNYCSSRNTQIPARGVGYIATQ